MDLTSAMQGAFSGSGSGYSLGSSDADDIASGNVGDSAGGWSGNTGNTTVNFGSNPFMPNATPKTLANYIPHIAVVAGLATVVMIMRKK